MCRKTICFDRQYVSSLRVRRSSDSVGEVFLLHRRWAEPFTPSSSGRFSSSLRFPSELPPVLLTSMSRLGVLGDPSSVPVPWSVVPFWQEDVVGGGPVWSGGELFLQFE